MKGHESISIILDPKKPQLDGIKEGRKKKKREGKALVSQCRGKKKKK